jgi:hypothetical protein
MEILRDPIWNNVRLDPLALDLLDTPVMQRLRYVRQLGLAFLVYPGATHSRFEHALGAFHLAGVALRLLEEHGALAGIAARDRAIIRAAALLHDVGHYPFSHALEEIGVTHHEQVARPLLTEGTIADVLSRHLGNGRRRVCVDCRTQYIAQGLISGLGLDKIEYLKRDATMCGVRMEKSMSIVAQLPRAGRAPRRIGHGIGIQEKGLSALSSPAVRQVPDVSERLLAPCGAQRPRRCTSVWWR